MSSLSSPIFSGKSALSCSSLRGRARDIPSTAPLHRGHGSRRDIGVYSTINIGRDIGVYSTVNISVWIGAYNYAWDLYLGR